MNRNLLLLLSVFLFSHLIGCRPSAKAVKHPHNGVPNGQVAIVYHDAYTVRLAGLEKIHPHPQQYENIYRSLLASGYLQPSDVYVPKQATREELELVHSKEYLDRLHNDPAFASKVLECSPIKVLGGKGVNQGVLKSFRYNVGGAILAVELAKRYGVAISLGGGYHHARAEMGEGFNPYNDIAIAIRAAQKAGLAKRVLVIDLDAHQGNGTARIFEGDNSVYTFSMHERDIYPSPKAKSDWDIHLRPNELTDQPYLTYLKKSLPKLFQEAKPDLVIFQGGVDVLAGDPLTHFQLTPNGVLQRDAMVLQAARSRDIPLVWVLGGGYGENAWRTQLKSIQTAMDTYGQGRRYPVRKFAK